METDDPAAQSVPEWRPLTLLAPVVLTEIVIIDKVQIEDATMDAIRWFEEIGLTDVALVGGKGANLGELTAAGLPVPPGLRGDRSGIP